MFSADLKWFCTTIDGNMVNAKWKNEKCRVHKRLKLKAMKITYMFIWNNLVFLLALDWKVYIQSTENRFMHDLHSKSVTIFFLSFWLRIQWEWNVDV